jgi:hypothetical protein
MNTVTMYVAGLDLEGRKVALLADNGFDDALITQERAGNSGVIELEVDEPITVDLLRRLISLAEGKGEVRVVAVGPSPVVNAADIADRIGRTRQSITQLASGSRGPGGWPTPINPGAGAPLWEWGHVARWLNHHLDCRIPTRDILAADTISWFNTMLRIANAEKVSEDDELIRKQARAIVHA